MSGPTRRVVAFDLGNVLIDYDPEATVSALGALGGVDRAIVRAVLFGAGLKDRQDGGELEPEELCAELSQAFQRMDGRAVPFEAFREAWTAAVTPRPGAPALVARLRPGVGHALWSNTDPLHFAKVAPDLPFLAQARAVFLSFRERVRKPSGVFFERALAATGAPAAAVTFMDDTEANVEAARALGIDAFRARTLDEVEAGLAARDLITPGGPSCRRSSSA